MSAAADYFGAEQAEGLVFIACGLLALGVAVAGWTLWRKPFMAGMAWPLALVAAIQLVVGATVWWRSPQDLQRVQTWVQQAPERLRREEIPRMQAVMRNFVLYRWVELAVLLAGVLLLVLAAPGSGWRGAGLGMAVQGGLMLLLDYFAEQRGHAYLAFLHELTR